MQELVQSIRLNGSAMGLTKNLTNKQIEPLTNVLYQESTNMVLTQT